MKRMTAVMIVMAGIITFCTAVHGKSLTEHPATDAGEGWRLGVQAYSFKEFTFYEAIDMSAAMGMNWIEAYGGQRLSKDRPSVKIGHNMPVELREEVKKKLAAANVKLVSYGVVGLPNNEAECRKVFEFAKDMGIENIGSEPKEDAFDLIERLCKEYKIAVAIHNHPKPSRYWNPDAVLKVCEGRSKWIGACADTGHWMRSGIDPLEALKKLEGRVIYFHMKDLNKFGVRKAHDVPWGTGKGNVREIMEYLNKIKWRGAVSAEYEHNWLNSVPEIRQCAIFFNKMGAELNPSGWRNLLADDLSNCKLKQGSWQLNDNVLTRVGGGNIWTKDKYGDFILDLEFKVAKGANSGVFIRCGDLKKWVHTTIEIQIHDTGDGTKHGPCGAIYDCLSPKKKLPPMADKWNHMTVKAVGPQIYVVLNGEQIIDMDVNDWAEPHKNPDYVGTRNKFNTAIKDMPRVGHIGFQDHGDPVWYRNVKIKHLDKAAKAKSSWPYANETKQQRNARKKWWRQARFGMFIHWGVYSVPAGTYKDKRIGGIGEWIMLRGKIPVAEYKKFAKQFNPVKYDPDAWVRLAKAAGMKYIVITAKHHDGFALFDSKVTDWDIVDATPYGKDLLEPLALACRKHGVKLGFYYSQAQDWCHPGGRTGAKGKPWDKAQKGDMNEYVRKIAVPQVKEILTNYGDIAILWWDTSWGIDRKKADMLHLPIRLQDGILTNNRLGGDYEGDFGTPEQKIPATGMPGRDWETCMTMNGTWGYKSYDHNWKSTEKLIKNLVDIASKGGNYLLNVGPTSLGEIPQPSIERLKEIGLWMKVNGEAIYATTASAFSKLTWGRCTKKVWDKSVTLYLHVFDWPEDGKLLVPGLQNQVLRTSMLADGQLLQAVKHKTGVIINVPDKPLDQYVTVIKLDVKGPLNIKQKLPK